MVENRLKWKENVAERNKNANLQDKGNTVDISSLSYGIDFRIYKFFK